MIQDKSREIEAKGKSSGLGQTGMKMNPSSASHYSYDLTQVT